MHGFSLATRTSGAEDNTYSAAVPPNNPRTACRLGKACLFCPEMVGAGELIKTWENLTLGHAKLCSIYLHQNAGCCVACFIFFDHLSYLSYLSYFWANYNNSQTWNKAIWGWFPLLTMIPVRAQWGRYNLPRYFSYLSCCAPGLLRRCAWSAPRNVGAAPSRRVFRCDDDLSRRWVCCHKQMGWNWGNKLMLHI
jgi:hypothetical protein